MKLLPHLPNALTLTNLALGALAIFALSEHRVLVALMLMGGCLVTDALDGFLARKLGVADGLGIQLDSLADIVSFGILPGIMIFFAGTNYNEQPSNDVLIAIFAALTVASAGLRLARFNIDERSRKYFHGLATPAGAMLVAGWIWAEYLDKDYGIGFTEIPLLPVIISCFLIVAYHLPLKLPNLKSPKEGFVTASFLVTSVLIGLFTIGPISIPLGVVIYVILGLLNLVLKWY